MRVDFFYKVGKKVGKKVENGLKTLPMIALVTSSAGVELLSSSARVTSVKSAKPLGWSD